jgi:hypothetical protein
VATDEVDEEGAIDTDWAVHQSLVQGVYGVDQGLRVQALTAPHATLLGGGVTEPASADGSDAALSSVAMRYIGGGMANNLAAADDSL